MNRPTLIFLVAAAACDCHASSERTARGNYEVAKLLLLQDGGPDTGVDAGADAGPCSLEYEWTRVRVASTMRYSDGVELVDFDGDGTLDVIGGFEAGLSFSCDDPSDYPNPLGRALGAWINPSAATVDYDWRACPIEYAEGNAYEGILGADFDGDGDVDIVGFGGPAEPHLAMRTGTCSFTHSTLPSEAGSDRYLMGIATDWDGDGDLDIIGGAQTRNLVLWTQGPIGTWTASELAVAKWPMRLRAEDIDADGDMDLYVAQRKEQTVGSDFYDNVLHWLRQNDDGSVTRMTIAQTSYDDGSDGAGASCFGDVDGDGDVDIVQPYYGDTIVWYERTSLTGWLEHSMGDPPDASSNYDPKECGTGDFNGDGHLDAVVYARDTGPENIFLGLGDGGSSWEWLTIGTNDSCEKCDGPRVLDVDVDGDLDLLFSDELGGENGDGLGIFVLRNDGCLP